MKKILFIQRILAALIDILVIYLPSQFLVFILFGRENSYQNWLSIILFLVYNVLSTVYFSGQTIGKYFASLKVTPVTKSLMEMGQREAIKLLYFLPLVGFIFMILSLLIYIKEGRFLHDKFAKSEVIVYGRN